MEQGTLSNFMNLINPSSITGHRSRHLWWCGQCGARNKGDNRFCVQCSRDSIERHAQVHASERAIVYRHPVTGEIRRPPRADTPMSDNYREQGFEREEIMSMIRHERETGSVHEATNFAPGNEPSPEREVIPQCPKDVKEALIRDVMAANASGNWTLDQPLQSITPE